MANERARTLRKAMSESERKLWRELRGRQMGGLRFRRQHPIGPYVADFVCLERRLVVEVDGAHHLEPVQSRHDAQRDRWLTGEGYRVMRFTNSDVFDNIDGVLEAIWSALQELSGAGAVRHPHRERHRT